MCSQPHINYLYINLYIYLYIFKYIYIYIYLYIAFRSPQRVYSPSPWTALSYSFRFSLGLSLPLLLSTRSAPRERKIRREEAKERSKHGDRVSLEPSVRSKRSLLSSLFVRSSAVAYSSSRVRLQLFSLRFRFLLNVGLVQNPLYATSTSALSTNARSGTMPISVSPKIRV